MTETLKSLNESEVPFIVGALIGVIFMLIKSFFEEGGFSQSCQTKYKRDEKVDDWCIELLSNYKQQEVLCFVIRDAVYSWNKEKAWKMFLADNPTHENLLWMAKDAPEQYKAKATDALLADNPKHDELRYLERYASDPHKAQAKNERLKRRLHQKSAQWKKQADARSAKI